MAGWRSRRLRAGPRTKDAAHRRFRQCVLVAAILAATAGVVTPASAWNPYDTDSGRSEQSRSWASSPGNYRAPQGYDDSAGQWDDRSGRSARSGYDQWDSNSQWYLPDAADGWAADQRSNDGGYGWGEVYTAPEQNAVDERWRFSPDNERGDRSASGWSPSGRSPTPHRSADARWDDERMRSGRRDHARPSSLYEDFRQPQWSRSAGRSPADSRAGDAFDWRRDGSTRWREHHLQGREAGGDHYNGYEFRPDSALSASRPNSRNGWVFRPLTGREQERFVSDGLYPPIDERDYRQRGPWRSYEDEGTAFGYHSEGPAYGPGVGEKPYRALQ
jgi:hypothetical protein